MKHLPWATAALLASLAAPAAEPPAHPFDGNWNTVLSCANARGALGYSFEFVSVVKDDVLHGEKGSKGEPGWLTLDGKLAADGAATLYASGLVGAAPYAVGTDRPAPPMATTSTPVSPATPARVTASKAVPAR